MKLIEQTQICAGFVPVDLSAAANNGDWLSLRDYNHATIIFFKAAGTAGDDPVLTLQQATDNTGTGAKALNFTELWQKQGTLTSVGTFTRKTQSAANTYTDTDSAENQGIYVLEIDADMLDVDNGFSHVRLNVADVGSNAQLGCALAILSEPRFAQATPPSAL